MLEAYSTIHFKMIYFCYILYIYRHIETWQIAKHNLASIQASKFIAELSAQQEKIAARGQFRHGLS